MMESVPSCLNIVTRFIELTNWSLSCYVTDRGSFELLYLGT